LLSVRFSPIHTKLSDSNEFNLPDFEAALLREEGKKKNFYENPPKCKLCNVTFTMVGQKVAKHLA
jgi:hypothetical protein